MSVQLNIFGTPEPTEESNIQKKSEQALAYLEEAHLNYKSLGVYALFSGGHDSLVSTYNTSFSPYFKGVVHIDTGIGVPETQQFVIDVCKKFGWPLKIYRATEHTKADGTPDPQIYEEFIKKWGFPGPSFHNTMYQRLKGRQIGRFIREMKTNRSDKIILSSGIRIEESERRKQKIEKTGIVQQDGAKVWVASIAHFTSADCETFMKMHDLPRNPVKDKLCMSGECLCGSFAEKGELDQLEYFYPETAKRIKELEAIAREHGHDWKWDQQPPKDRAKERRERANGQMFLDLDIFMPMCHSCQAKVESLEENS